ncbi:MAG: hypothetical protein PHI47_07770 [Sulfuricurvum sp.]|uniref:hypothetical protein n=1 Tax=Sulfuricurvum sp. TaxID=2025608 RepID=UPI002622DA14|nr:hypothetical protein [Sulfuricurvum sp.]MDD5159930.1 hypothetical protein [Sulfuricurvum sp.]
MSRIIKVGNMMDLKQRLIDFGCSLEFVDIALNYENLYPSEQDIEFFIEYVEEEYAKIEALEEVKSIDKEIVDASGLFQEFEDEI